MILHGYTLEGDWKHSANGRYIFGVRDGVEYFIKEFPEPIYPPDGSGSPAVLERRRKICRNFEEHQNKLLFELKKLAGTGGNLVVGVEFFRENQRYYKTTRKIDTSTMTAKSIAKLSDSTKLLLFKTVSHSLRTLHRAKIVHGDLKPDNILITNSEAGTLTTKIIDFDSSYFESEPPKSENTVGTVSYYSPELALHVINEEGDYSQNVTCKSDVFALGIIFHELWSGEKPLFGGYRYVYEPLLDEDEDGRLVLDASIPPELLNLIEKMLHPYYEKRPAISEIFEELKRIESVHVSEPPPSAEINIDGKTASIVRMSGNQYKLIFDDGKTMLVPAFYLKSKGIKI